MLQHSLIEHLKERGKGCKKGGRRCSVEKQFDLVDIENMAFSHHLFIEPEQKNRDQLKSPTTPNIKVSRYPRTVLPKELKSRFEFEIKSERPY